ncbi:MAG: hypothetical protein N3G19_03940, partial [Candidatus Pacearchaeota archaeon]|nr:hypothetical protein [Candidatus Pacearchaeota archaeon]
MKEIEKDKSKERMLILAIAIVFLTLYSANLVYALGISPGRVTFDFEPGAEKNVVLKVINTEHKAMNVSVVVEGEWAGYVKLSQVSLEFRPDEWEKSLNYSVNFPSEGGAEGIKAKIVVSEFVPEKKTGTSVGVLLAVEHQLYVLTNFTNLSKKSGELNITNVSIKNYQMGQTAQIDIEVNNPSPKSFEDVYATMAIYDKYGNLRSQFNSTPVRIEPYSSEVIEVYWDTYGFENGGYGGELVVYYDNQTKKQDLIFLLRPDRVEV